MARYDQFVYGDGTLYGTSPANANLLWTFIVDWDQDGYFSGDNEAVYMVDLRVERGRDFILNPGGKGFEKMGTGQAVGTFVNDDGRYDPYNTSSPLYPDVQPGGRVRIAVKNTNTGTDYDVMYGVVDDVQPVTINGQPHARIIVSDGLRWLKDQKVLIGYLETNDLQTIVEYILDGVDWPWSVSADDSALMADTLDYWYCWQEPALDLLREMEEGQAGVMFHGRDGTFYFFNRDYTHNRTQAITQSEILIDIALSQPWEQIRNNIEVAYYLKAEEDLNFPPVTYNALWNGVLGSAGFIDLPDGETVSVDATFKYQGYRIAGADEDIVFAAYDDDTITDITADCDVTWEQPVGGGTRIYITNNSGGDGYASALEMDGDAIYAWFKSSRTAEDATSQASYGPRTLSLDSFWQEDPDIAQAIADWLLAEFKDPTLGVIIQFEAQPDYQFYLDLWDRIELTIAKKDINANFRIGKIEHEWLQENGQAVRTMFKLEPYITVFS